MNWYKYAIMKMKKADSPAIDNDQRCRDCGAFLGEEEKQKNMEICIKCKKNHDNTVYHFMKPETSLENRK